MSTEPITDPPKELAEQEGSGEVGATPSTTRLHESAVPLPASVSLSIKSLPNDERPREKLKDRGANSLSDAEILAVFFGSGTKGVNAVEMGRRLIGHFGSLRQLSRATREELMQIPGIGPVKALKLLAVLEFGRRLAREPYRERSIASPEDVYELLAPEMQALAQESVRVVLLNHRKRLIQAPEIFKGTGNESFANPAEILRQAIVLSANALILVHNHPSGDPSPSRADHEVTRRLNTACQAVGVELTDHIIIGSPSPSRDSPYFSFREAGLL